MEKTRKEIEDLKESWFSDPHWDLEGTEGFESHREELITYTVKCEKEWNRQRLMRELSEIIERKNRELVTLERSLAFLLRND